MLLESLVRPFATLDTTPAISIPTEAPQPVSNVVLQIGKHAQGKVFSGSYSYSATFYAIKKIKEQTKADTSLGFNV